MSSLTVHAQEAPTITLDPVVVPLGDTTNVGGSGFEPGVVRIFLDSTAKEPVSEVDHAGRFDVSVEGIAVSEGPHTVIACNNQGRTGVCRQEAIASMRVIANTTTTTTPRATTTTTPRSTTTAPPRTTTTTRVTTTTAPGGTTSTSILPPTVPPINATTTAPSVATIAPTTIGGVAVATTVAGPPTIPPNVVASTPGGPDPTSDPTPADLEIVTTTEGPAFQSSSSNDDYTILLTDHANNSWSSARSRPISMVSTAV